MDPLSTIKNSCSKYHSFQSTSNRSLGKFWFKTIKGRLQIKEFLGSLFCCYLLIFIEKQPQKHSNSAKLSTAQYCLILPFFTITVPLQWHTANYFMVNLIDFDYVINPTTVPSRFWPILIINLTVSKSFKVINKYHKNCKIYLLKIQYFFNRSGRFLPWL